MPFTIAHAAAVLPLRNIGNLRLPLPALMIGSMAPDFAYFVPVTENFATHSIPGLFWFCWPVGILMWLFFVRVLERPTIALLPDAWRTRLAPTAPLTARLSGLASIAVVLGAVTHLIWDSFTHADTPVVNAFPLMREITLRIGPAHLPLYHLLQILSSLAGLTVLAIWGWRLRSAPLISPQPQVLPAVSSRTRWVAAAALVFGSCALALGYVALHPHAGSGARAFYFMIGGMAGWVLAWSGVAVWVHRGLRAATR